MKGFEGLKGIPAFQGVPSKGLVPRNDLNLLVLLAEGAGFDGLVSLDAFSETFIAVFAGLCIDAEE